MLTAMNIREQLAERPFEPFRVCMSDGDKFVVRHPEMCIVTPNAVHIGIPHPEEKGLAIRVAKCAIMHITRLEPVNGRRPRTARNAKRRRR
jgi:hypothetical protein